ncbi:OmcA/MtrC family decaheme c-type cytochrome [Paraferrimonas haliotis]|uniref:Cytochrome c n=1 Tax=Paraferrimonas haliotis TaxID=2013866 RepID=A0AA37WYW6_9GAMM|nr:OmcA/MtrC family decaheme c-type cytochrome [Paraferrimonas haliotis]GLS84245.1 cytochrome c [Paraferrimonas haliotis]
MKTHFNFNLAAKALLSAGVLSLALSGCGKDGKDGEDGNPGEPGGPGPVTIDIQDATSLNAAILDAQINDGTITVDFDLTNANGVAVSGLKELENINGLGFGIAKLTELQTRSRPLPGYAPSAPSATPMKGTKSLQWTSYINNMVQPVPPTNTDGFPADWDQHQGAQFQANIESSCKTACIEQLEEAGHYRYTFSKKINEYSDIEVIDTSFDGDLVHRVTMELAVTRGGPKEKLINTFYDFIPSTGTAAPADESRNLVSLKESCIRCHSDDYDHPWAPKLVLHGGKRFEIENCVVCHTTYSGDPETGATIDFGSMLHRIHKANYFMVGYGGSGHDYSDVTFPAEYNACQACHIEGEGAPAQANFYNFHRQEACLSCHEKYAPADWDGTARGLFHYADADGNYQFEKAWAEGCNSCHADSDNPIGATKFHMATQTARMKAAEMFALETRNGTFTRDGQGIATGTLTFELKLTNPSDDSVYAQAPNEIAELSKLPIRVYGNGEQDYTFPGDLDTNGNNVRFDVIAELNKGDSSALSVADGQDGFKVYTFTGAQLKDTDVANLTSHLEVCAEKGGEAIDCAATDDQGQPIKPVIAKVLTPAIGVGQNARRLVVDAAKCQNCHEGQLNTSKTGIHQNVPEMGCGTACHDVSELSGNLQDGTCLSCHNATTSTHHLSWGHVLTLNQSLDFKVLAHTLHASKRADKITYPNHYANCASCHDKGQLTMGDTANQLALVVAETDGSKVQTEISPIASTCGSCHEGHGGSSFKAHVESNGGVYYAPVGTYVPGDETCAACHAEGKTLGVDKVHPTQY